MSPRDLVLEALRAPQETAHWSPPTWAALLSQARAAGLWGRVVAACQTAAQQGPTWPEPVQGHADAAVRLCLAQQAEVRRECLHLRKALAPLGVPVVLLKGAAYVMAGLPAAEGRIFSDVDILVPEAALGPVENSLMMAGWLSTHQSAYDQRYYRQWMHELPPMQHVQRQTTLDVHHNILPRTARLRPDGGLLLASALPLPGQPGLFTLQPADMVLHSMTHLFMNDDMGHALRDLSDLDLLLRHFAHAPSFWPQLTDRATALDLRRPLFYGLRWLQALLDTPVPAAVLATTQSWGPGGLLAKLMDGLWRRALHSPHPDAAPGTRPIALGMLYLRGHWLRMPLGMLSRHLTIKALRLHQRDKAGNDAGT